MSETTSKGRLAWIRNPLVYIPLLGIGVYLIFFRPHSNNITDESDSEVHCTTAETQDQQFQLICWIGSDILVEDPVGNRFEVEEEDLNCSGNFVLQEFNPEYEYYIKVNSPETLFTGMTIDEVVKVTGDYVYGDVEQGEYSFPYVVAVQGKIRHYGLKIFTGSDGKVEMVDIGARTSSNWFGALPFYSDIVSLNMFTAFSTPILQDLSEDEESGGIISWLLGVIWGIIKFVLFILLYFVFIFVVFAIPLCILFPILRLFSFLKSVPNWLITTTVWTIGVIIVYVITIGQVEGTRSVWLLTMPICLTVGFSVIGYFYLKINDYRCPECRKDKALDVTREAVAEHTYIKEEEHASKGDTRYVGKNKGRKIYNQDIDYWTTEREITITEYLVTETCKYCGYTHQYNVKETQKGERVETDRWTDVRVVTRKIQKPQTPTYYGNYDTVRDENGRTYDRVEDTYAGSDVIQHKGNKYKRRF